MGNKLDWDEAHLTRVVNPCVRVLAETVVSEFHKGQKATKLHYWAARRGAP